MRSITSISPTISALMGIEPPALAHGPPLSDVIRAARRVFASRTVEKCLIYAADAIGSSLFNRHNSSFSQVTRNAPIRVQLSSVFPPKTPVCFASIFTGAQPKAHGIRKYERPVLTCDTLFDALARGGKKVAIVAVEDCSVSIIFRGRKIDYFIEPYDDEVIERALRLLASGSHDFIVAYNQGYDDVMHKTVPESPQSLRALRNHVRDFDRLVTEMKDVWGDKDAALMWMTDHGAHIDTVTGKGTHGERIPEDMRINEFFGFYPRT
jgi:predicted AlkP superfamily pyrophosphatase or phosphodiesterase